MRRALGRTRDSGEAWDGLDVMVVCAYYRPRNNAPAIRLGHFVDELALYHDVKVVTGEPGPPAEPDSRVSVQRWKRLAQYNHRPLYERSAMDLALGLVACGAIIRYRPDVVVVSSPVFLTALLSSAAARLARVPLVLDIRDPYPEVLAASGHLDRDGQVYRLLARGARRMYGWAKTVVTVTDGFRSFVELAADDRVEVVVVENGYPAALMEVENPKFEQFTAVFHGTLGSLQDVAGLVSLAKELESSGIQLLVVGKGADEGSLNSAPSNLKFVGELSFNETMDLVSRAHVGISLRTPDYVSESAFPVKIYEYIGLGLPIVVSPKSDAGKIVQNAGMGRSFDTTDVSKIAETIKELSGDSDLYSEFQANVRRNRGTFVREDRAVRFRRLVEAAANGSERGQESYTLARP